MTSPGNAKHPSIAQVLHPPLYVLFLLLWLAVMGLMLSPRVPVQEHWQWVQGLFLGLATATTLVAMARRLPAQNVAVAVLLIALISGAVQAVGATTGIPFGVFAYTNSLGPVLFDTLPVLVPLVWMVAIVNSRGVARLILRPWRKTKLYGFCVIGLTCLLTVLFDFGLEPFAVQVNRFWIWQASNTMPAWYTAPWINFFGRATTTLLILAFATPWLINKKSVRQPPDYHPLTVWLLLTGFLATGNASHQLWLAAGFGLLSGVTVTVFALRGARSSFPDQ